MLTRRVDTQTVLVEGKQKGSLMPFLPQKATTNMGAHTKLSVCVALFKLNSDIPW